MLRSLTGHLALGLLSLAAAFVLFVRIRYGGGDEPLAIPNSKATRDAGELEVVASLPLPPCNIAVSEQGRVFFTFHPEGHPDLNVVEWVEGEAQPFPAEQFQHGGEPLRFQTVQSLRIDRQGRLWALDHGSHGFGQPRLLAFDVRTREVLVRHDFPSDVAPPGSQLNDFHVSPTGDHVYIADASIFGKRPALVVFDTKAGRSRRVLDRHPSVVAEERWIRRGHEDVAVLGVFAIRPNVDSIALDAAGRTLYFAPTTSSQLHRVPTALLDDPSVTEAQLAAAVEAYAPKPASDGIAMGADGTIYITDPQASAVHAIGVDRQLTTLFRAPILHWPDGFSFGPGGYLYLTNSALDSVLMRSRASILAAGPYTVVRFRVPHAGAPGH